MNPGLPDHWRTRIQKHTFKSWLVGRFNAEEVRKSRSLNVHSFFFCIHSYFFRSFLFDTCSCDIKYSYQIQIISSLIGWRKSLVALWIKVLGFTFEVNKFELQLHRSQFAGTEEYTDPPPHQWVSKTWQTISWQGSSNAGALGNTEYPFNAIALRSTRTQSGSTWQGPTYGSYWTKQGKQIIYDKLNRRNKTA